MSLLGCFLLKNIILVGREKKAILREWFLEEGTCRWGECDRAFHRHTCWACHLLHTTHTYTQDGQQGTSCSRFAHRSSCTESLKDEWQTNLDISLCFKDIQCPLGRKTNPLYKVQWSHVSNRYSLYLTPEWCWEKILFFLYGKAWHLSMCRVWLLCKYIFVTQALSKHSSTNSLFLLTSITHTTV